MQSKVYTSRPFGADDLPPLEGAARADVEFHGVDHSGASFEGRVFLNNPEADENTPLTSEDGYAGSFFIFGHGGCFGDVGHCEVHEEPGLYDPRAAHPLTPIKTAVIATSALRRAAAEGRDVEVTVVPVITGLTEQTDAEDVFKFDHLSIVTYESEEQAAERQAPPAAQV